MHQAATVGRVTPVDYFWSGAWIGPLAHMFAPTPLGVSTALATIGGGLAIMAGGLLAQVAPGDIAVSVEKTGTALAQAGIFGCVAIVLRVAIPVLDKQWSEARAARARRLELDHKHRERMARISGVTAKETRRIEQLEEWVRDAYRRHPDLPSPPDEPDTSEFGAQG
jgi:hypothetical protein